MEPIFLFGLLVIIGILLTGGVLYMRASSLERDIILEHTEKTSPSPPDPFEPGPGTGGINAENEDGELAASYET